MVKKKQESEFRSNFTVSWNIHEHASAKIDRFFR